MTPFTASAGNELLRSKAARPRHRRLFRLSLYTLLALIFAWPLIAWLAARALIAEAPLARADAMAVLSGSGVYVERAQLAARLYRDGHTPQILLTNDNEQSGWSVTEQRNPLFVERAAAELRREGVPAKSVRVLPDPVFSTYDEAAGLRRYAEAEKLRSLLIVTSAYHSRRALWVFRRVFSGSGIQVGLKAVDSGQQSPPALTWWLSRNGWKFVAAEYVKLLFYRFNY